MQNPAVSVVMPCYNAAAFVDAAVSSIRSQTFADFELIIVDDGSDDRTVEILRHHEVGDSRLRVLRKPHRGICETLNDGIALARGVYVARMDADDVALPTRLERQVAVLSAQASVALVGSNYEIIDASGAKLGASDLPGDSARIRATLEYSNCIAHPTVLMRRDALIAAGGYRRAFRQCEDYDLWVRLSERYDLINLPEPLVLYRRHPGQLEWRDVEQRALSMLGVRASARQRSRGLPDPAERFHRVTREYLHEVGMDDRSISEGVTRWALAAAAMALAAGQCRAARNALEVAERQPHVAILTRLRCRLIRVRSFVRLGRPGQDGVISNHPAANWNAARRVAGVLHRALTPIGRKLLRWDEKSPLQKSIASYRLLYLVAALISWFPIPIRHLLFWFGSDKHRPLFHSYGWTYQEIFRPLKYRRVKLLEIGVGGTDKDIGGRSLLAWRAFFPRATIVGFDYKYKDPLATRHVRIHRGDQGSSSDLAQLRAVAGTFDIIIDDGSHLSQNQLTSFHLLFGALRENGIYVIEDVQTSYWPAQIGGVHWDGADPEDPQFSATCMGFFLGLAKYLSYVEFLRAPDPNSPFVPFMTQVRKIAFEHNLIVIVKGDNREPSVLSLTTHPRGDPNA